MKIIIRENLSSYFLVGVIIFVNQLSATDVTEDILDDYFSKSKPSLKNESINEIESLGIFKTLRPFSDESDLELVQHFSEFWKACSEKNIQKIYEFADPSIKANDVYWKRWT